MSIGNYTYTIVKMDAKYIRKGRSLDISIQYTMQAYEMDESKTETERWEFTTDKVNPYRLSADVREMCSDTDVYWMTSKQFQQYIKLRDSGFQLTL